ncbi:MAG: hypothetical protein HYX62_10265 [Gammaproteobacteria bacterium]|nr:hypothetical protein [Gammaproteobacteria bacterium]
MQKMPEENPDRVLGFLKFGMRAHLEELLREGRLYMNPLSNFIQMESDALRADKDEGLRFSVAATGAKLSVKIDGEWEPVGTIAGPIKHLDPPMQQVNVFCMYALRPTIATTHIDSRNFSFGDSFVAFTNGDEFLRRARAEAARLGLTLKTGLVRYVDRETHKGPMGIFRKFSSFSFQSEFRVALLPGTGKPYSLRLGDLSDIAIIGDLKSINDRIRVYSKNN